MKLYYSGKITILLFHIVKIPTWFWQNYSRNFGKFGSQLFSLKILVAPKFNTETSSTLKKNHLNSLIINFFLKKNIPIIRFFLKKEKKKTKFQCKFPNKIVCGVFLRKKRPNSAENFQAKLFVAFLKEKKTKFQWKFPSETACDVFWKKKWPNSSENFPEKLLVTLVGKATNICF